MTVVVHPAKYLQKKKNKNGQEDVPSLQQKRFRRLATVYCNRVLSVGALP